MGKKRNPTHSIHSPISAASKVATPPEIRPECEHGDSGLVHQVHGRVHAKLTALIEDSAAKQKHIKSAIESAQRATGLDPNSTEFVHFFASLLFDYMAECEKVLSVESPLDPTDESLHTSKETVASTPARINQVQGELKNLVHQCNLVSVSQLQAEQVEYRVPMGPTAPPPSRNNKINKASETLDECRKEIEVCVAAVRLLQQKHADPAQSPSTTSSEPHSVEHSSDEEPPSGFHCHKLVSRKPVKSFSSNRMEDQLRAYWNSMTAEKQLRLLRASIPEMKFHYASLKEIAMLDLLSEALSFAEESGSWEFWICFKCGEKFSDAMSHLNHVRAHVGMMSDLAMEAIPKEVNPDWVGMLTNTSLKPIDVESVIRSSDEANNGNSNLLKDTDSDNSNYASPASCLEREVKENGDCNGFEKMECEFKGGDDAGGRLHKWPLSDDPERVKLLEKIQSMFSSMIKHQCLSTRHVRKLLEFANDQIKAYPLPSNVLDICGEDLERTPLGLCFLDASKLRAVLTFLQELSHTGGLRKLPEKDAFAGNADGATKNSADFDTIKLDIKSSALTIEGAEVDKVLRDANALFQWIYAGPFIADQLAAWSCSKEEKSNQALELVQTLEKELSLCQTLCERKLEYLQTLQMLELLENLREEKGSSFVEFLKKGYDELIERQGEELLIGSSQDELDLIISLVKEAYQQFNVNHYVYEDDVGSRLRDGLISDVLSSKKDNLSSELNKLDVQIMRGVAGMRLLELKLGPASLFDYRFVLIPLIKSFVRERLEELVKDRSDAVTEAFLAALAKDDNKYSLNGESKQSNEKSKVKKKGRDYRKSKSPKVSSMNTVVIHEETTEKFEVAMGDNMDGITADENLNQDEEENDLMSQFEAIIANYMNDLQSSINTGDILPADLEGICVGDLDFSEINDGFNADKQLDAESDNAEPSKGAIGEKISTNR